MPRVSTCLLCGMSKVLRGGFIVCLHCDVGSTHTIEGCDLCQNAAGRMSQLEQQIRGER